MLQVPLIPNSPSNQTPLAGGQMQTQDTSFSGKPLGNEARSRLEDYFTCKMLKEMGGNCAERLVIPWRVGTCCCDEEPGPYGDLLPNDDRGIPPPLAARGVSAAQWDTLVRSFFSDVAPHADETCLVMATLLGFMCIIPGMIMLCAPTHKCTKLNGKVVEWLAQVNSALQQFGCFAKFQRVRGEGKDAGEGNVLAIAMSPAEIQQLKSEPVLLVANCCNCCASRKYDPGDQQF